MRGSDAWGAVGSRGTLRGCCRVCHCTRHVAGQASQPASHPACQWMRCDAWHAAIERRGSSAGTWWWDELRLFLPCVHDAAVGLSCSTVGDVVCTIYTTHFDIVLGQLPSDAGTDAARLKRTNGQAGVDGIDQQASKMSSSAAIRARRVCGK